jgi:FixJ family two-component response regulator
MGAAMFSKQAWDEIARSLNLSGRELQIIKDVFDDRTEFAIAAHYGVSPHTIHTHCYVFNHMFEEHDRVKLVLRITDEFLALTATPGSTLPSICTNRSAGRCPLRRA